jgi:uncharacterized membrane protein YvbJ
MINCPHCNTSADEDQKECSSCGILFSKWHEREENVASGNMGRYTKIANATSSEFNWTMLVILCVSLAGAFYLMWHHAIQ